MQINLGSESINKRNRGENYEFQFKHIKMEKNIYLVEDDGDIRELIRYLLSKYGYNVIQCATANIFREKMNELFPDLIILDIMLPDGNGVDICAEIKSNEATRHIPVLLMSANINNALKFNKSAAEGFISKPFNIDDLLEKVKHMVA
jgi:DNA-binding response OmpR family regulator